LRLLRFLIHCIYLQKKNINQQIKPRTDVIPVLHPTKLPSFLLPSLQFHLGKEAN